MRTVYRNNSAGRPISRYISKNGAKYGHRYYGTLIETRIHSALYRMVTLSYPSNNRNNVR